MDFLYSNILTILIAIAVFILGRKTAHLGISITNKDDDKISNKTVAGNPKPEEAIKPLLKIEYVLYHEQSCEHFHKSEVLEETEMHYKLQFNCDDNNYSKWVNKDSTYIKELIPEKEDTSDEILDVQLFD